MGFFDKLAGNSTQPPPYPTSNQPSAKLGQQNPYPPVNPQASYPSQSSSNNVGPSSSDDRPLPPGWEKQWHDGYQRFFYVDTRAPGGPQSHWIHPADQNNNQNQRAGYGPSPSQQPYYPQPAPQPMYYPSQPAAAVNPPTRKPGVNPLMAGAGGLAGGMLLGSLLGGSHHHHSSYDDGYMQGYENGYDNGFDNGDGYGGGDFGDFGGGDFF